MKLDVAVRRYSSTGTPIEPTGAATLREGRGPRVPLLERARAADVGALVNQSFQRSARSAGILKASSSPAWRHAAATLLLEGGADLRHVQAYLGHAHVQTTVGYTHVELDVLKAAHEAQHPLSNIPLDQPAG